MSQPAIIIENLSKQYRLGDVGTGTLSHDLKRWWYALLGKEDPFAKIGETNDRTQKGNSEYVWALKDINLQINQGEAVGIIGRNGAGKSTLLKLLSKTTAPTTGSIKVKGRIASLLEVGTGFHPELSGRDNIYLNGAILGMRKREIDRKLDEIVDFAGIERYLDTPVKRYSSGMYVRLAFAVAAHLDSDILIVDEVLAVGDAEFQKKCLGKMGEVSKGEGRTVLFVSHNMTAVNSLCDQGVLMQNGRINFIGDIESTISNYLTLGSELNTKKIYSTNNPFGDDICKLLEVGLVDEKDNQLNAIEFENGGYIYLKYKIEKEGFLPIPNAHFFSQKGEYVLVSSPSKDQISSMVGLHFAKVQIPPHFLNEGRYIVGMAISTVIPQIIHMYDSEALTFDVIENMDKRSNDYRGAIPGIVRPHLIWETKKVL